MKAPNKIYVEVCEDGIFAFPEPPFKESVEYIRADLVEQHLQQEQPGNWDEQYREDDLRTRFAFYAYKDEDSVLYLSNVFVEEASRRKGLGTKILQAAENVAKTIGSTAIRLKVKQNSPANDWYRKYGYGYLTFEGEYDWLEKNLEYLKPKQEQPEVDLEKVYDAYCKVCGHYHHTTPAYICRHACDYFKDFKALLNARKED